MSDLLEKHPADRHPWGLQPRPLWQRIVSGLVGLVYLAGAYVGLAIFSVASEVHGWFFATLAYLPGLLLLTLGIGLGRRPVAFVCAAGVALALGSWSYWSAPPTHERLEAVVADVGAPAGWTEVSRFERGNTWGLWGSWPEVALTYGVPGSADGAADAYTSRLEEQGWERDSDHPSSASDDPETLREVWERGRWTISVGVEGPGARGREFDSVVDSELTKVVVSVSGQR